jgi:hypothetical protein
MQAMDGDSRIIVDVLDKFTIYFFFDQIVSTNITQAVVGVNRDSKCSTNKS